jgi:serine protease inhibitor
MMVGSKITSSNQRPDTLMQDRTLPDQRNLLHRTAGPYIGVNRDRSIFAGSPLWPESGRLHNDAKGQFPTSVDSLTCVDLGPIVGVIIGTVARLKLALIVGHDKSAAFCRITAMSNQIEWTRRGAAFLPLWLMGASLSACAKFDGMSDSAIAEQAFSDPATDTTVAVVEVNSIGLRLFAQTLKQQQAGNVVVSPLSLAVALQMAADGAAGRTEAAFEQALRIEPAHVDKVSRDLGALARMLLQRNASVTFQLINGIWLSPGIKPQESYVEAQRVRFDARVQAADFSDPATAQAINKWYAENTHGLISDMISNIAPDTRVLLANALYFKGEWQTPFEPSQTASGPFRIGGKQTRNMPMMHTHGSFAYVKTPNYQSIRLPFANGDYEVIIALSDQKLDARSWIRSLDQDGLAKLLNAECSKGTGNLALPSLEISTGKDISMILKALGFAEAFGNGADFSRLAAAQIRLSEVIHRVVLKWDEKGAEAAAGTAGRMVPLSLIRDTFEMIVDRPFLAALRHVPSGALLLIGLIEDPTQKIA